MPLKQRFGIWGQQLWLFPNGQWNEPLVQEINDRTTISSSTTLPHDEPDYEAALTFLLSEATRLTGQLRSEQLQAREFSLGIRFMDFTEVGASHRFRHPQFLNSVINTILEQMFREIMREQRKAVRQIRIALFNLERLDTQPTLWGRTNAERWGALDDATFQLNQRLGKTALMTGAQFALRHIDASQNQPKAKCPFTPQRGMIAKLWGNKPPGKPVQGVLLAKPPTARASTSAGKLSWTTPPPRCGIHYRSYHRPDQWQCHEFVSKTPEQFACDDDGNLLQDGRWNYTWDAENRLVKLAARMGVGPQISL